MKFYPRMPGEGDTKDFFEARESINLLAPKLFDATEWHVFIRDHRCATCAGHLLGKHEDDRMYSVFCPNHGPITETNYIGAHDAEKVKQAITDGKHELKDKPDHGSADDILKELGF